MKKFVSALVIALSVLSPSMAKADNTTQSKPTHHWGGIDISAGVPSGIQGGIMFRPYVEWLNIEVGVGHNLAAPGVFGSITLDSIPWGLGLTLTGEAGYYWSGPVPFVNNPPSVGYYYGTLMPGIALGNFRRWRFYVRGGVAWMHADVSNFDSNSSSGNTNFAIGPIKANMTAAPSVKLGLSLYF